MSASSLFGEFRMSKVLIIRGADGEVICIVPQSIANIPRPHEKIPHFSETLGVE